MPRLFLLLASLGAWALFAFPAAAQVAADTAVQVSATVTNAPPQIQLHWPANASATAFSVYRKAPSATTWGNPLVSLPGSATGWTDTAVAVGTSYEYWVSASSNTGANGYLLSGIEVPLVESRGKVILIVDSTNAAALSTELSRLEQDLAGDGWIVLRHDVLPTDSVPSVKRIIVSENARDPANVKAVFLFGHVPVPYAGAIAPDGHGNHYGAWPADLFYGDVDGVWTDDQNFDSTVAGRQHNVAGDGKYDQSTSPSAIDLEVGRVDLSNMPAFAPKTELDLLRQYLNKDHNFREKAITAQPRGLIDDNFGYFGGEAFASSGWRNFSAFFGASNVFALDWFTTLATQSYLWAYGCGGGNFTGAGGVGSTSNFVTTDTQVVFTMLFGSYFGDWDTTNNFLRAPLATTTYGLTDAWSGRPLWYFHHMGLGNEIGFSARATQNNTGIYAGAYGPAVHIALMGDPTLRMHIVAPPTAVGAVPAGGSVTLSWTASADSILGYNVYRATSPRGPFARLNGALVAGTAFTDSAVAALASGTYTYAVRAVRVETSASGSYFNASQAAFADAAAGLGAAASDLEVTLDSAPSSAVIGAPLAFVAAIRNHGPADASNVQAELTVPAGITLTSVTPSSGCAVTASQVVCNAGPLARGAAAAWTISGTASAAGTLVSTATVTGSPADPFAGNNSASVTTTVVATSPTTTVLSSSLNPSTLGQSVTFTATVSSAAGGTRTGTVVFRDGSGTIGSSPVNAGGQATLATASLPLGPRSITAAYGGDAHFGSSTSAPMIQSVRANTTTTLTSSRNPSVFGAAVTFTVHVTSSSGTPTGFVSFTDGGTGIASTSLDASGFGSFTTSTLAVGTHSVAASYAGDQSFNPSSSAALSEIVNAAPAAATTTTLVSAPNPSMTGQTITLTATVTSTTAGTRTGTVAFLEGSILLGSSPVGASGHAPFTTSALTPGSHSIHAIYNGDATFAPSSSATLVQVVQTATSLVVTSSLNASGPGQLVTITATVVPATQSIGIPSGTVTFFDNGVSDATASVFYPGKAVWTSTTLAAGRHAITATYGGDSLFASSTAPAMFQIVTAAWNRSDFSGDGKADLVWARDTGVGEVWYLGAGSFVGYGNLLKQSDTAWKIVGTADFNGDGKADLLWQRSSGEVMAWFLNGTTFMSSASLPTVADPAWKIVATGDFNGDGKPDIVWHRDSGETIVWFMNGTAVTGYGSFPTVTDPAWKIVGAADFNGDGLPDLMWRRTTGENLVWFLNGTTFTGASYLPNVPDPAWKVGAIADYNSDGKPDIMWRRDTGENEIWYLDGTAFSGYVLLPTIVDPTWKAVGPR